MSKIKNTTKQIFLGMGLLVALAGTSNIYGMMDWEASGQPPEKTKMSVKASELESALRYTFLSDADKISELRIEGAGNDTLQLLNQFSILLELDLSQSRNLTSLAGIESCAKLAELDLSNTSIEDISMLQELSSLTILKLYWCDNITDEDLQYLPGSLSHLDLWSTSITGTGLKYLPESLEVLYLRETPVRGLLSLQKLSRLTELDLGQCENITNEDLKYLPESLKELYLDSTLITDLSGLKHLTNLEILGKPDGSELEGEELQEFLDSL